MHQAPFDSVNFCQAALVVSKKPKEKFQRSETHFCKSKQKTCFCKKYHTTAEELGDFLFFMSLKRKAISGSGTTPPGKDPRKTELSTPQKEENQTNMATDFEALRSLIETLGTKMDRIENKLETIGGRLEAVEGRLEAVESQLEALEKNNLPIEVIMEKVMDETVLRETRKKELKLMDVCESTKAGPAERVKEDKEAAFLTLKELFGGLLEEDIVFCRRLGGYDQGLAKPRPLLVGLVSSIERERILIAARRAKNPQVKPSLTKMQTERIKELYKLRDQKNGENPQSPKIWIVAGPPGEQQLRQVNKRHY